MISHNETRGRWNDLSFLSFSKATFYFLEPNVDITFRTSVSDPDPDWIRIQSGQWIWIRIQEGKNDPTKIEKS
jgi:hypothetical protein